MGQNTAYNWHNSFKFLGFQFQPRTCKSKAGKYFQIFKPAISMDNQAKIKESIRTTVYWHSTSQTLDNIAKVLNSKLMGCGMVWMKKIIWIIILHVAFCGEIFSQRTDVKNTEWQKNQIKFSPLRIFNWYTPGLELSYQRNYGKYASQISIAYLTAIVDNVYIFTYGDLTSDETFYGYRLNFEEKFFFQKVAMHNMRTFISSEIGYNNIDTKRERIFAPLDANGKLDEANQYSLNNKLNRQSIIFNVKVGMEFRIKQLTLEWGVGLGFKHQNVQYFDKRDPTDQRVFGFEDIISPLCEKEGRYFIPNFPITFKIGYTF